MPPRNTQADGLGWMEDVWRTVLRKHTIDIDGDDTPLSESSGFILATSPISTHTTELAQLSPSLAQNESSEGATAHNQAAIEPETKEEHLQESARETLNVLAPLLEAGAGLMPAIFLDRVRSSSLLTDERLHHDIDSLRRIQVVLNSNLEG